MGAGRSWTAAMISVLSIPRRYRDVIAGSACPSCLWMTISEIPSRDISTACACLNWWGANRRRTLAIAAAWCGCARIPAGAHGRPWVGPRTTQNSWPTGSWLLRSSHRFCLCNHSCAAGERQLRRGDEATADRESLCPPCWEALAPGLRSGCAACCLLGPIPGGLDRRHRSPLATVGDLRPGRL